jgi:uncharacterized protein YggT (Ycf19 family)
MSLKRVTTTEVVDNTESNIDSKKNVPYFLSSEFIYWIFGIIEGLLVIRFLFRLAGANSGATFVAFIYRLTDVLMRPFRFIFPNTVSEGIVFEWSVLVAMLIYALLTWTIIHLISILYTAEQID